MQAEQQLDNQVADVAAFLPKFIAFKMEMESATQRLNALQEEHKNFDRLQKSARTDAEQLQCLDAARDMLVRKQQLEPVMEELFARGPRLMDEFADLLAPIMCSGSEKHIASVQWIIDDLKPALNQRQHNRLFGTARKPTE
jgi:hypothetical protein